MWLLESKLLFSVFQFGYRKALSTFDVLMCLEPHIRNLFDITQTVIAGFFDLEKAHDTAWQYILRVMHSFGINGNVGFFLQQFLSNRDFLGASYNNVILFPST